jgi:hypothetical protein
MAEWFWNWRHVPAWLPQILSSSCDGLFRPWTFTTVPCNVAQVATCWLVHLYSTGDLFGLGLKPQPLVLRFPWSSSVPSRIRRGCKDRIYSLPYSDHEDRGRLGSRSRGYQPVAPKPIAAGPLCSAICSARHLQRHERPLLVKDGITGTEWPVNLACDSDFHVNHRVLLHAVNLRHGTDGFTSPPKEGMLWIFSPEKSEGFGRDRTRDLGYQRPAC